MGKSPAEDTQPRSDETTCVPASRATLLPVPPLSPQDTGDQKHLPGTLPGPCSGLYNDAVTCWAW
jgi:hypothetical protein